MLGISIGIAPWSASWRTTAARSSIEKTSAAACRAASSSGAATLTCRQVCHPALPPTELEALRALPGIRAVTSERETQMTSSAMAGSRQHGRRARRRAAQPANAQLQLVEGRAFAPSDFMTTAATSWCSSRRHRDNLFRKGREGRGPHVLRRLADSTPSRRRPKSPGSSPPPQWAWPAQ